MEWLSGFHFDHKIDLGERSCFQLDLLIANPVSHRNSVSSIYKRASVKYVLTIVNVIGLQGENTKSQAFCHT